MAGGFVLGEVLGLQNEVALCVVGVMGLTFFSLAVLCFGLRTKGRSLWLWLLPFLVCAGFWRGGEVRMACDRELALGLEGVRVTATGEVVKREQREDGSYRMILRDIQGKIQNQNEKTAENERFKLGWLQVYLDDTFSIGARILVSGTIQSFDEARNPGEFDYRLYARSQKLNYRMFVDASALETTGNRPIRERIAQFRMWAGAVLERIADPEDYGIYRAVILGDDSRMDEDLYGLYQENGVAHLLAVSGLHLSLMSAAVYGTLRKVGAGFGLSGLAGAAVLMLYAVLTGESSSVLRALIMGICGFGAAYLGRTYDLMSAWSLALMVLLWDSPYRLLQAGVQLSFGALAGIGWLAPRLIRWRGSGNDNTVSGSMGHRERISQAVIVSVSIQLVTLPVLLYHYFQYPLYGILLNFLMVPLMGGVVASGAAGIALSAISLTAAHFALGSGHMILNWYEICCRAAECLPGNVVAAGRPEVWEIGVYYGVLAAVTFSKRIQYALLIAGVVFLLFIRIPASNLKVTFLDVGQGDGICIQSGTKTILVDGGSTDQKQLGEYRLVPFLHSQGIFSIDYAIISHGDADHISGLQYLLETGEVAVEHLILPAPGRGQDVYEELSNLVKENGGQVYWMARGDQIRIRSAGQNKDVNITCLSPDKAMKTEDPNEHSLVLKMDYDDFHMLLTGDMTEANEREILDVYGHIGLTEVQVLKVAHHGSDTSSSEVWIQEIHPRWAILSYGDGNRYGHPKASVVERLRSHQARIYETAKSGAVTLETDGEKIRWSEFLVEE